MGVGGGTVDKGRSGNQEFSFGNAELQISIRYALGRQLDIQVWIWKKCLGYGYKMVLAIDGHLKSGGS